ncbi:MAG: hypothetical protein KJO31_18805 [Gammaproteobacteria bacterium]|nr:hypothetical protein [Gammaproteobacteria bacterium]
MQLETMRIANNVLGLTLLCMLAMALIAGQLRGKSENPAYMALDRSELPTSGLILAKERLESLPELVESVTSFPLSIEIHYDGVTVRPERSQGNRRLGD